MIMDDCMQMMLGLWLGGFAGLACGVAFAAGRGMMDKDDALALGLMALAWPFFLQVAVVALPFVGVYWIAKRINGR